MPVQERHKTKYPGVYYIIGKGVGVGKPEKIFYIYYRKNGKIVTEKAGRQFQDDMTSARAAYMRSARIEGKELSNAERRSAERAKHEIEQNRWTVSRLWEEYQKVNADVKGLAISRNRFKNYLEKPFGKKEPRDIAPFEVDRLRIALLKTKKPATVAAVLELLRRIANFGAKRNLCARLYFTFKMPSCHAEKTEDLTPDQLKCLLDALDSTENKTISAFMKMVLFTGMRRGELFKLAWDDIDFRRGVIFIRNPKGGKDQVIPLNDDARRELKGIVRTDSPFVFPGRDGKQRTDIKRAANTIKKCAKLPKSFRPLHGLRHVFASMIASSGKVDMYTLQRLLTHKDPRMTQRYAHLRDETLKHGAAVAGNLINEAMKKPADNIVEIEKPMG